MPSNALTAAEEQAILDVCHRPAFANLPPDQIVVRLLDDEHRYLASVSSFYRVLRRHGEVIHRGRAKAPKRSAPPTTYQAKAPNQVWSWDCTWLPGPAKGTYYYLVMILDIYSRKIVGWEAFFAESARNSRTVIERAVLAEKIIDKPLVLHADNYLDSYRLRFTDTDRLSTASIAAAPCRRIEDRRGAYRSGGDSYQPHLWVR